MALWKPSSSSDKCKATCYASSFLSCPCWIKFVCRPQKQHFLLATTFPIRDCSTCYNCQRNLNWTWLLRQNVQQSYYERLDTNMQHACNCSGMASVLMMPNHPWVYVVKLDCSRDNMGMGASDSPFFTSALPLVFLIAFRVPNGYVWKDTLWLGWRQRFQLNTPIDAHPIALNTATRWC